MIPDPILFLYTIGIICFIIGIEYNPSKQPNNYIYLGLSFMINYMGYMLSYSSTDYTQLAYLPLIILILTVIIMLYRIFEIIKNEVSDGFKEDKGDKEDD